MSSPAGVRQRGSKDKKRPTTPNPEVLQEKVFNYVEKPKREFKPDQGGEWDYKIAIVIITILAFVTRFWGINYPAEVVFDEVHFGKVRGHATFQREQWLAMTMDKADKPDSLLPTTCNAPTSSMSILPLESSYSHSPVG